MEKKVAEKLTYTSCEQHIRNTYQTLNEVEIVLFIRKTNECYGAKVHEKMTEITQIEN